MGGGIDLWNNSDSSMSGIGDNWFDITDGVDSSNLSGLTDFWPGRYEHGETILINDVPMQNVEFREEHEVNGSFDVFHI